MLHQYKQVIEHRSKDLTFCLQKFCQTLIYAVLHAISTSLVHFGSNFQGLFFKLGCLRIRVKSFCLGAWQVKNEFRWDSGTEVKIIVLGRLVDCPTQLFCTWIFIC